MTSRPRTYKIVLTPDPIVVGALGILEIEMDLQDTYYPQIFYKSTWAATAATTGLQVEVFRGYEVTGTTVEYTDTADSVTVNSQPIINILIPQTTRNDFSMDTHLYPRRVKIRFTNLDTTNSCTLMVVGDG